jgi:hypothetical protein
MFDEVEQAVELLEKANAGLEPELLTVAQAQQQLQTYARVQRLVAFGVAVLARRIDDAASLARIAGTSVGKAKDRLETSKVLEDSPALKEAMKHGEVSLDQASEIARAEESAPGVATELLAVAQKESFSVLREKARKAKLEAEQHRGLASASTPLAAPAATATSSAWSTFISPGNPTSGRLSTGRRPRPPGCTAGPEETAAASRSSVTSPMPMHRSLRVGERGGRGVRS